jgi:hypothetical protein
MTIRKRIGAVSLGLVAVVLMGQLPLVAQEPAPSKPAAPTARKKQDLSRRVPNYFGQIGLTNEQRASIYSLQAKLLDNLRKAAAEPAPKATASSKPAETPTPKPAN